MSSKPSFTLFENLTNCLSLIGTNQVACRYVLAHFALRKVSVRENGAQFCCGTKDLGLPSLCVAPWDYLRTSTLGESCVWFGKPSSQKAVLLQVRKP